MAKQSLTIYPNDTFLIGGDLFYGVVIEKVNNRWVFFCNTFNPQGVQTQAHIYTSQLTRGMKAGTVVKTNCPELNWDMPMNEQRAHLAKQTAFTAK